MRSPTLAPRRLPTWPAPCVARLVAPLLATASFLIAAPAFAGADPRPSALPDLAEKWIRAETSHLILYSNASEEGTLEIARRIERYRAALGRIGPALSIDSPLPTSIFVFRNGTSFQPYKLLTRGEASGLTANIDGYFIQHSEGNYIAVNATPLNDPWPVIYHEYFHFFLYNNFTDIPLWLAEGMAECYGTFQTEGPEARIGGAIAPHVQWLKAHPLMPLPHLFEVSFESTDYHQRGKQETFYAQSWALTHYLIWGAGIGGPGIGFLRHLPRGGSLADAIAPSIADPARLEKGLEAYLRSRKFAYNEIELGRPPEMSARVTPVARAETLYRLGDLLLHADVARLRDAESHFREAVRVQPSYAAAHAGLGQALAGRGRRDEARAAFEKAYALDPADRAIAMKYAAALVEGASPQGIGPVLAADALPDDLMRARAIFERMTREDSGSVEAWAGLGSTYAYAGGDLAPGVAALERARALAPSRIDIATNLCLLYSRGGQRVRARELYDRVVSRSDDPAMRLAGREAVFWGEVEDATRVLESGDRAAGLERLRGLAATAPSPAMKAQVEAQLRASQDFVGRQGEVDAFNKAVAMANAKDYDGAAKALEALLATSPGEKVAEPARRLLSEVRAVALYNDAVRHFNKQDFRGALALLDKMPKEVKGHPVVEAAATLRKQAKAALDAPQN